MVAPVVSGLEIEYGQATDPGLDPAKRVNEDACAYAETPIGHLFVLCDGMGGHAGGKQASDIAVRTIFEVAQGGGEPAEVLKALPSKETSKFAQPPTASRLVNSVRVQAAACM